MGNFLEKANNASTTVAGFVRDDVTTIIVASVATLPVSFDYNLTIWDATAHPDPSDDDLAEVVKVTSATGTTLTVTRAQEGTAAATHTAGSAVALLITTAHSDEWESAIDLNTVHAADSSQAHSDYLVNNDDDSTSGTLTAANLIVDGVITVPYLAGAPASLVNGMIWMEADGIHLYRGGAEKTVTDT